MELSRNIKRAADALAERREQIVRDAESVRELLVERRAAEPGARLVDGRTRAAWGWVGRIPGAVEIERNQYPGGGRNPHFAAELRRQVDPEALVMFICRSGVRSIAAAAQACELGYTNCYNVLEGFEGDRDARGQRNKVGGWRHAGLPWHQG